MSSRFQPAYHPCCLIHCECCFVYISNAKVIMYEQWYNLKQKQKHKKKQHYSYCAYKQWWRLMVICLFRSDIFFGFKWGFFYAGPNYFKSYQSLNLIIFKYVSFVSRHSLKSQLNRNLHRNQRICETVPKCTTQSWCPTHFNDILLHWL